MSRSEDESRLEGTIARLLRSFMDRAKAIVSGSPGLDPTGIYALQPDWNDSVDTILTEIGKVGINAWSSATDVPPVSRHAFVVTYLADVQNLLVRIPDEVANLVFAEITDGTNAGESKEQIAARVNKVLSYTESERWPNRAKVIAQTEVNRAYGAGTMAAGIEQARVTGRQLGKTWLAHDDERTRIGHRDVDGVTVPVWYPFYVAGEPLQFPGDPSGSPSNVINCRCSLRIVDGRA
jgi:hypothetical protein